MERDHQTTLPVVLITWCLSVGSISGVLARESQLIGSPQPIIALAGDDVILPCSLEPSINAEKLTVEWSRPGLDKYVHVYQHGRNSVRDQNPFYSYRTSLFEGELINGNVSLKLSRVKLEDEGDYRCLIPSYSQVKEVVIQLIVVAVSEPKISILEVYNTVVVLQCEAESWYPEPQLDWREGPKDSEGRLLSADDTQTYIEHDGRYTVRSNLTVQKTDTNKFTCRVQLLKNNKKREAEFNVPGGFFHAQSTDQSTIQSTVQSIVQSSFPGWAIAVTAAVCFLAGGGGVVAVFRLWKKGIIKFAGLKLDRLFPQRMGPTASPQEKKPMRTEEQIP